MKTILNIISSCFMIGVLGLTSCTSEAPFSNEGEGLVRMNVSVNTNVTRSVDEDEANSLRENCTIYISNTNGVLHKWIGVQNIPQEGVYLKYGSYLAEAFAGDSVTASFDSRYFKGRQEFSVGAQVESTQVNIVCKIANVVTSIDRGTIDYDQVEGLKVVFENSRGDLTFQGDDLYRKGYFMMPDGDSTIKYTISGTNVLKGNVFSKTGEIENVKPGHEYRMEFNWTSSGSDDGGAMFNIIIVEENLVEEEVIIYGAPAFSWVGDNSPSIDEQLIGTPGTFESKTLRIAAYKGFEALIMTTTDPVLIRELGGSEFEIDDMTPQGMSNMEERGIRITTADPSDDLYKYFIEFSADFLNRLPASEKEYVITIQAEDMQEIPKDGIMKVRIANTEAAIIYTSPVRLDPTSWDNESNPMAILSRSATLPIVFTKDDVQNPALQYREEGSSNWSVVPVSVTRAVSGIAEISGLKAGTTYECRAVAGNFTNGEYEFASDIAKFTTETEFSIPNWSMEEWSTYGSGITFPGSGDTRTFWDSGNEGAKKANDILTTGSTDMAHTGAKSARLESKFASVFGIGKFAAGNLFAGTYVKTDGTDGVLEFGRPYDGSHPSKLSVWVNYQPAEITDKKTDALEGKTHDIGQIYVALSTEPVEIRTKGSAKLFKADDPCILAYGEKTFEEAYEENGGLKHLEIPLDYYAKAKSEKPLYLIIVCSASKFGDYFEGGRGSLMYVDDFELVYE